MNTQVQLLTVATVKAKSCKIQLYLFMKSEGISAESSFYFQKSIGRVRSQCMERPCLLPRAPTISILPDWHLCDAHYYPPYSSRTKIPLHFLPNTIGQFEINTFSKQYIFSCCHRNSLKLSFDTVSKN